MSKEQIIERPEAEDTEWLSEGAVTRRLIEIVNADASGLENRNQLKEWMSQHGVFETFKAAINSYGRQGSLDYYFDTTGCLSESIFDELEIGEDGEETRLFQARLIKSPSSAGPAIHTYARDGGIPTYGVFLPFTERGKLDVSRSISGGHFASDGLYSFNPPREPIVDDKGRELILNPEKATRTDKEIASVIAYATQMSAAQLAFYLEKDEPRKPETKQDNTPAEEQDGHKHIKRSRLAGMIGRVAAPLSRLYS